MKQLVERLLGCDELPEPEIDVDAFVEGVQRAQAGIEPVYNPLSGRMAPWVLTDQLKRACGKDEGCVLM